MADKKTIGKIKLKKKCRKWSHGKKIMGKFEVGHWMGAKKRGGGNAGYRTFEKGPGTAFHTTEVACGVSSVAGACTSW